MSENEQETDTRGCACIVFVLIMTAVGFFTLGWATALGHLG